MMQIRWDWKYPRDRGCPSHDRVCHRVMSSCFSIPTEHTSVGIGFTLMVSFACFGEQSTFSFIAPATIPDHPLSSANPRSRPTHPYLCHAWRQVLGLDAAASAEKAMPHDTFICRIRAGLCHAGCSRRLRAEASFNSQAGWCHAGRRRDVYVFVASELAGVTLDVEDGSAQKLHSIPKLAGVMLGGERMAEFGRVTDWNRARQQLRRTRQIRDRCTCFFHPTTIPCHLRPHSSYTLESRSPCLPTAQR
ncbi:hypothetical protein BDZ89DRAFT_403699 [Hymenopellis radicata]|nr:hypothetical protein BDZ89DRAFT_403699 [Hymenopellis radicata]